MQYQVARTADVDAVADTIALAFVTDPVWGVALALPDGSTDHLRQYWSFYVRGALAYSTAYMTPDAGAVAVWIPPGGNEFSDGLEEELTTFARTVFPPESMVALEQLAVRFDAAHPHDEPHAYLSILATHPAQRGKGIAQQLLAANLESFALPAYLESTNPANNHRYERAGFRKVGGFEAVLTDAPITTMWRDA